jgi:predicted TIM-barrel fold metal-dependent hydrolase
MVNVPVVITDPSRSRNHRTRIAQAKKLAPRAAALGWHLEFLVPNWSLKELFPFLGTLQCDFSVGHMGVFPAALGVEQGGFSELLRARRRALLDQVHGCLPHLEARRFFGYRFARMGVRFE